MTFTKLFASITESTVWCESSDVRIVWVTMLAMANQNGKVFGSIPGLANRARVAIPAVEEALKKFMAPDPYSRTKDFEGRRIEEIDGGWKLLTYEKHSNYRHEDERREYMRELMRKRRSVSNSVSSVSIPLADVSSVSHSKPALANADADGDADKEKTKRVAHFVRPTREEVLSYCRERKNQIDPDKFLDYYDAVGWMRGPSRIKNWRACVRTWEKKNYGGQFNDGYTKSEGRPGRTNVQHERARNNVAAVLAAFPEMGGSSSPDGAGQEARRSGWDTPLLEGEVKKVE